MYHYEIYSEHMHVAACDIISSLYNSYCTIDFTYARLEFSHDIILLCDHMF